MATAAATKSRLTRQETARLKELRTIMMDMRDVGRWTRADGGTAEQRACQDEISRLVARRDGKMWL